MSRFTSMSYQSLYKIVTDNYIADEPKLSKENWGVGVADNHLHGLFAKNEAPGKHTC